MPRKTADDADGAFDGAMRAFYGEQLAKLLHASTISEMVPVKMMFREPEYARPIDARRVTHMATTWNPLQCLDVVLSFRDDGRYALIDGSHRCAACCLRGTNGEADPPVLPSRVFIDLTIEQEAELFRAFNEGQKRASRMDVFRAAWRAGNAQARTIREICNNAGFDVAIDGHGANRIDAVYALEQMYTRTGAAGLLATLAILADAWGTDGQVKQVTHAWVLLGMMNFWARYNADSRYDRAWLVSKLRSSEPEIVLGRSQKHRTIKSGVTPPLAVGRVTLEMFNAGRPSHKRLPEWQNHALGSEARERIREARRRDARRRNAA